MQVKTVQHGVGSRGAKSRITGELVCGPETLSEEELVKNRENLWQSVLTRPLDGPYYHERTGDLSKVTVPLLSAGNWGGQGLHPRGNFEGYMRAASQRKWLEVHGGSHWAPLYTDYGVKLQKRFFDFFLKGVANGGDRQPRVLLQVRHPGEKFVERHENEWPLARTAWTHFYLDPRNKSFSPTAVAAEQSITYDAMGEGVTFSTPPLEQETEFTGPSALKLFVSSSTSDADLFIVLRVFDPSGKEVVFQGALDPHTPIGQGWLRASHRKLDKKLSLPFRPYHSHDEKQPLKPGQVHELDIEIIPTCIVVPKGHRVALSVRGRDYVYPGGSGGKLSNMKNEFTGNGPFLHDDPRDRPVAIYGGKTTIHLGGGRENFVLLPIIPAKPAKAKAGKPARRAAKSKRRK